MGGIHMKTLNILLFFIFIISVNVYSQLLFRSGMFFHHSTGLCIWGPNGSTTSVPQQMTIYNNSHGYTGTNAVTMNEIWFPAEDDNEWCRWHRIFENQDTAANIQPYYAGNRIMVIKSCFPSSNIEAIGEPSDTLYPDYKTIFNYKWHWRHIINVMKTHPQNFFVIWTNAPLVPNQTTTQEALYSHYFCKWAKDTLANGLDPVFGPFPPNVYVFDFFHKLVGADYMLLLMYATSSDDSHPNAAATQLVAPQFVNEIFNASIAYEFIYGIKKVGSQVSHFELYQNYPNPFNPVTRINFDIPKNEYVTLKIFDILGKEVTILVDEPLTPGKYEVKFDGSGLSSGMYFYKLVAGTFNETKRMILLK
ncbi:MAG: T9SS type A sorting domain-containing protein [Ignavibacteria bacterium]|nr:T9SS type A sorting domain-containing protein [Ignavibacteria bacterium]